MIEGAAFEDNREQLLAAMRGAVEVATDENSKYLASKNLLQMELALYHVDGERDLSDDEWIARYGGFLSMVIDSDPGIREKMLSGTLSNEDKVDIISRAHELYIEAMN